MEQEQQSQAKRKHLPRLLTGLLLLVALLSFTVSATAANSASAANKDSKKPTECPTNPNGATVTGLITSIVGDILIVEEEKTKTVTTVKVTEKTAFYNKQAGVQITLKELKVGELAFVSGSFNDDKSITAETVAVGLIPKNTETNAVNIELKPAEPKPEVPAADPNVLNVFGKIQNIEGNRITLEDPKQNNKIVIVTVTDKTEFLSKEHKHGITLKDLKWGDTIYVDGVRGDAEGMVTATRVVYIPPVKEGPKC